MLGARADGADRASAPGRGLLLVFLVLGGAAYLLVGSRLLLPADYTTFGTQVYDYYFLSLVEGRFDVPARIISLEGHYDASGRAFVYHGLAPLLTRVLAWPLVDLRTVEFSRWSIWIFTVGGTLAYHLLFDRLVRETADRRGFPNGHATFWRVCVGVAIWGSGPGILLAANRALYHEPVAASYCFGGWFLFLLSGVMVRRHSAGQALLPLSLLAGLTTHARPHVAIGLYLGVLALMVVHLLQEPPRWIRGVAMPMAVLLLSGVAFLVFNALRYDDALRIHGSFGGADVEMGITYWGFESDSSPRVAGFKEHGRFNASRVLPNAVLYAVDVPLEPLASRIESLYRSATRQLGFIRIENPRTGFVFLWAPWIALVLLGLRRSTAEWRDPYPGWVGVLAGAVAAVLMMAYATVTARYRIDVWPLIASLAMIALPRALALPGSSDQARRLPLREVALIGSLAAALVVSILSVGLYRYEFPELGGFTRWDETRCREIVATREEFGPADIDRICSL